MLSHIGHLSLMLSRVIRIMVISILWIFKQNKHFDMLSPTGNEELILVLLQHGIVDICVLSNSNNLLSDRNTFILSFTASFNSFTNKNVGASASEHVPVLWMCRIIQSSWSCYVCVNSYFNQYRVVLIKLNKFHLGSNEINTLCVPGKRSALFSLVIFARSLNSSFPKICGQHETHGHN